MSPAQVAPKNQTTNEIRNRNYQIVREKRYMLHANDIEMLLWIWLVRNKKVNKTEEFTKKSADCSEVFAQCWNGKRNAMQKKRIPSVR